MASLWALSLFILFGLLLPSTVSADGPAWQEDRIIVNHSIEEVEKIVTACWDYEHLFRHVTKSRKLSANQCYLEAQFVGYDMAWIKIKLDPRGVDADGKTVRMTARMIDGNIDFFEARGKMTKLGDKKTLVVLRVKGDPGITGIPDIFIESQIRKLIRDALIRLSTRLLVGRF